MDEWKRISALRDRAVRDPRKLHQAWSELHTLLSSAELREKEFEQLWLEHLAGRYADDLIGLYRNHRSEAGCILWDYIRAGLNGPEEGLASLWNQLQWQEPLWLQAAGRIATRAGEAGDAFLLGATQLILGGFSVARFAIALALQARFIAPDDSGFSFHETPATSLRKAFAAYANFWGPAEIHPRWTPPPVQLRLPETFDNTHLAMAARTAWADALSSATTRQPPNECLPAEASEGAVRIGAAMTLRAIEWLLNPQTYGPRRDATRTTWVLLAGPQSGSSARLSLEPDATPRHGAAAYPDPISMGILPLDAAWRRGFDNAAKYTLSARTGDAPSWRWKLRFLSDIDADHVLGKASSFASRSALRRPYCLEGDSASASFAALLVAAQTDKLVNRRVAMTAGITPFGDLTPVGGLREKLTPELWHSFLRTHVRQLLVRKPQDDDTQAWYDAFASAAFGGRKERLVEIERIDDAIPVFTARPTTRRRFLAAVIASAGIGFAVYRFRDQAPASTVFAHQVNFDVYVLPKGFNRQPGIPLGLAELPLAPGDGVQFRVSSQHDYFFYLLWIDALGAVTPVWPWKNFDWNQRSPDGDVPRSILTFPADRDYFTLQEDAEGIHAVVLVALRDPLQLDENLLTPLQHAPNQAGLSPLQMELCARVEGDRILWEKDRSPLAIGKTRRAADLLSFVHRFTTDLTSADQIAKAVCFAFGDRS